MTAKDYLIRARGIEDEIRQLERMRREAHDRATKCKDPKQDVYENVLEEQIKELHKLKAEIEVTIEKVDNRLYRELLRARYLEGMTWEQIAVDRDCSYQNIVQFLHPKALAAVSTLLENT